MFTATALKQLVREFSEGLTRKRVRGHAVILGTILWGTYLFNLATPGLIDRFGNVKGADFLHFYVLGRIARERLGALLYDPESQIELAGRLVPQSLGHWYLPAYGPQYSLICAPFAALPYGWAAAAWMLAGALMYGTCCNAIWRACRNLRAEFPTVIVLALAFPGFFSMVGGGQNSALALGAFTAAFFSLRANRPLPAGLAIGLLAYKPQLGLMAALLFICTLDWKVILGALITGCGQFAVAAWYYGNSVIGAYLQNLSKLNQYAYYLEPRLAKMHSLRAFWQLLLPWPKAAYVMYVLTGLAVAFATVRYWRSKAPLGLRFAAFLLATALVDPHLTDYDLVILVPAMLLVGDWVLQTAPSFQRDAAKVLMYAIYALPVFAPMLAITHVQFSVVAMAALLYLLVGLTPTPESRLQDETEKVGFA